MFLNLYITNDIFTKSLEIYRIQGEAFKANFSYSSNLTAALDFLGTTTGNATSFASSTTSAFFRGAHFAFGLTTGSSTTGSSTTSSTTSAFFRGARFAFAFTTGSSTDSSTDSTT